MTAAAIRSRAVLVTLAVAVMGCGGASTEPSATGSASPTRDGADGTTVVAAPGERSDADTSGDPEASPDDAVVPAGFDRSAARAVAADGTECVLCLWIAASDAQRRQGLMDVTDLGGADGMVFVYSTPRTGTFWMKDTVLPLSIAFYDLGGDHVGEFDMEPCTADPCRSYATPADFTYAIEVEQGRLAELALGPGGTFELLDLPCPD